MPRTEERRRGHGPRDLDPYLVETTLTLAEWRQRRDQPFVEVVVRHVAGSPN
jgi:hypothetical protein